MTKVKSTYIAPSSGYFEIDNGNSVYRLMENLTKPMNQDALAEFYGRAKENGDALPMNAPQHIELFEDVVKSGDSNLLNHLKEKLRKNWLNTLTRIVYNPIGQKDEVIHNYGTSDSYSVKGDIVGDDNWIDKINNINSLKHLVGTREIKKLNNLSDKINQTPMYLWRYNSKPREKEEGVFSFDAGSGGLGLDACGDPSDGDPAFLVERIK